MIATLIASGAIGIALGLGFYGLHVLTVGHEDKKKEWRE